MKVVITQEMIDRGRIRAYYAGSNCYYIMREFDNAFTRIAKNQWIIRGVIYNIPEAAMEWYLHIGIASPITFTVKISPR